MKMDRKPKAESSSSKVKTAKKARGSTTKTASKPNGKHLPMPYEHAPIGILESSLKGEYLNVNEEFCRILGYEKQELLKGSIQDFTYEEDYAIDAKLYQQLGAGEIPFYRLEKRYVHKDGLVVWTELTRSAVRDAKGKIIYIVSSIVDISERKKAEAQVKWQAHLLAELGDAVLATDENFVFTSWNKSAEEIYGWKASEVIGKNSREILQTEFVGTTRQQVLEQAARTGNFSGEVTQLRKDGTRVAIEAKSIGIHDDDGILKGYVSVNRDITQRKQAEDALRESQQRFAGTYEHAPIGIVECSREGKYLNVNEEFCRIVERHKEELIGHGFKGISHEDDYPIDMHLHQKLVAKEIPFYRLEKRFVRKTGEIIWVEITRTLVQDAVGNPLYSIGAVLDISERKDVERVLRESVERLRLATESARMFMWEWDLQKQTYKADENFEKVLGFSAGLMPQGSVDSVQNLMPPEDREALMSALTNAVQGHAGQLSQQIRMIHPESGAIIWLELSGKIVYDDEGNAIRVFGVSQNITERKKAQEEITIISRMPEENPNPVMRLTPDGRVLYANPRSQSLLASWKEEIDQTIPDRLQRSIVETFHSSAKKEIEVEQKNKTFSFTLAPIPDGGYVNLYGTEITERKRAEQSLKEYARQQEALYQLADQLHRTNALDSVFNAALDAILNALQCDRASILLYDHSNVMRFVAWRGLSEEYRKATDGHSPWTPDTQDPEPIAMDNVDTADLGDSLRAVIKKEGIGSLAFIPLVSDDKLIGKFMVYFNTPHVFHESELDLSLTIAHQIAFGVDRVRTQESLARERELLERVFETMPVMVSIYDPLTSKPNFNAHFEKLIGWKPEEVTLLSLLEACYPDLEYRKYVAQTLATCPPGEWLDVQMHTRDGRVLDTTWSNIRFSNGMNVGLGIDITDRKRAEENLRKSQGQLQAMFTQAGVGVVLMEDDCKMLQVNPKFCEIVGYDESELLGRSCLNLTYEEDRPANIRVIDELMAGTAETTGLEKRYIRKDGSLVWVQLNIAKIKDAGGEMKQLVAIVEDITERKQIEEALRIENERFMRFFNSNIVGILIANADGKVTLANDYYLRLLGVSRQDFAEGKVDWRQFTPPEWLPADEKAIQELRERGVCEPYEKEYVRADGTRVPVYLTDAMLPGTEEEIVAFAIDITERKRGEREIHQLNLKLQEQVDELNTLLEILPTAVWIANHDCSVLTGNSAAYQLLNLPPGSNASFTHPESDVPAGLKMFMSGAEVDLEDAPMQQVARTGKALSNFENELVFPDGTRKAIYGSIVPLFDQHGAVRKVIGSYTDFTERKQAEKRLALLAEISELIRRLDDPDELLYSISEAVGEHLQVKRCLFNEIDVEHDVEIVHRDYCRGVESVAGVHKVSDYSSVTSAEMAAGKTVVNYDSKLDPRTASDYERSYVPNGERAYITVPMMRVNRWVASLWVSDDKPRAWSNEDVSLLEAIAERTWTAVEKLRIAEELRAKETELEEIINQTPFMLTRCTRDLRYRFVSRAYAEMIGRTPEEIAGKPIIEIMGEEGFKTILPYVEQVLQGKSLEYENEVSFQGVGAPFLHVAYTPDWDEQGNVIGWFASIVDISERRRAEQALRESEERYRGIVNQSIGGIAETDLTGKFTMVNNRYCEMTGYPRAKLLSGMRMQDLTHPDDLQKNTDMFGRLAADGTSFEIEKRYVRSDGSIVWVHNSVSAITGADGKPQSAVAVVIDVTERKRAEEQLRASETLYRTIARSIPGGGVYVVDKDFRYVVAEGPVTDAFGLSRQVLEGRTVLEAFPDERGVRMEERLRRNLAGEVVSYETNFNGRVYWTQQAAIEESPGQVIILTLDITERKQAEEALRESEERFRAILRQATAGIIRKDEHGRLIFVNQAFCNMLGYTEADLLGKTVWDFMHEEDVAENKQLYERLMIEGVPFKQERRMIREDGSIIWVDASVSPIMDVTGRPQSVVAVEVDITARKQAEDALQQLNLQLENRVQLRTVKLNNAIQTLRDEIAERRKVELALRRSEATARLLFNTAPDAIVITDNMGVIVHVNAQIANLFGYDTDEILGKPVEVLIPERYHDRHMQHRQMYNEQRTKRTMGLGMELFGKRKNGSEFPVDVMLTPIANIPSWDIMVTIRDTTERKEMESALQKSHERLRILSQRLVEVQEEERRGLARELHDRVGQTLAALNINLIIINSQLTQEVSQQIGTRLNDSMKLVAETIALVRDVMTDLRPAVLDDYGLEAAIEAHVNQFISRYDINARLEKPGQPLPRLGPSIEMTFMRIAQEALMNIARHAQATQVTLSLKQTEDTVSMIVQDNGIGIASWQDANRPGSHGLTIMRERAEAFGGHLHVKSVPNQGTSIEVSIPYRNQNQRKGQEEHRL